MKLTILMAIILCTLLCGCNKAPTTANEPTTTIPATQESTTIESEDEEPPLFYIETTVNPFEDFGDWFGEPIELPEDEL